MDYPKKQIIPRYLEIRMAKSDIEMYSGGLEYLKKYGNSNSALTIGSLFKGINNDSKNIFEINNNAIWKQDDNLSQAYDYSENIQSGFLMFEKEFDNHISVNVGVRGEYSDISGGVENENSRIVDTTYFNFFPSFSISKDLSKKWNVNLSYSRRIGRPSLAELNPFVQYIDSISYFVGNPLLKPEYSNSFDLSLTYLKFASINLSYSHTEDPVFQYVGTVKQGQKTNTFVTSKNFNFSRKYNLSMVIPYRIGGFTTYNNIGVSHLKLNNNGVGSEVLELSDENLMVYGQSSNEFTTENNWTFDATYKYNSKGKNGLFEYNTRHILSLSVGKKFFDKKLKVRLLYNDVFRTSNIHSKAQLSNYKIRYTGDYDKSYVRLYISYSFHKKAKQKGLKSNLNEDFKRINRM